MPAQSEEMKFSAQIEKYTEKMGMDYGITVIKCLSRGPDIQKQMFDLCLNFLSAWAFRFSEGTVTSEHKMYKVCEMSWKMMNALHDTGAGTAD